eukprot:PhM_4_TR14608/c0_g2_i1/m.31522
MRPTTTAKIHRPGTVYTTSRRPISSRITPLNLLENNTKATNHQHHHLPLQRRLRLLENIAHGVMQKILENTDVVVPQEEQHSIRTRLSQEIESVISVVNGGNGALQEKDIRRIVRREREALGLPLTGFKSFASSSRVSSPGKARAPVPPPMPPNQYRLEPMKKQQQPKKAVPAPLHHEDIAETSKNNDFIQYGYTPSNTLNSTGGGGGGAEHFSIGSSTSPNERLCQLRALESDPWSRHVKHEVERAQQDERHRKERTRRDQEKFRAELDRQIEETKKAKGADEEKNAFLAKQQHSAAIAEEQRRVADMERRQRRTEHLVKEREGLAQEIRTTRIRNQLQQKEHAKKVAKELQLDAQKQVEEVMRRRAEAQAKMERDRKINDELRAQREADDKRAKELDRKVAFEAQERARLDEERRQRDRDAILQKQNSLLDRALTVFDASAARAKEVEARVQKEIEDKQRKDEEELRRAHENRIRARHDLLAGLDEQIKLRALDAQKAEEERHKAWEEQNRQKMRLEEDEKVRAQLAASRREAYKKGIRDQLVEQRDKHLGGYEPQPSIVRQYAAKLW